MMRWTMLLLVGTLGCQGELPRELAPAELGSSRAHAAERPPPSTLRVAVLSDLNGRYGSLRYGEAVHRAVERVIALRPDLVLSTGDMVAGQRAGLDYERMWSSFHAAVSDALREERIPFAVTPGNHDASGYPAYAHERAIYVEQWLARRPPVDFQSEEHYPLRYSFVKGNALFIALDATTTGPLDDAQMAWLERELNRGAHHLVKIVFGHVPLYPFAEGRQREHLGDPALESLLVQHGVSLFLSGHHHAYYPGRRGPLRLVSTACLGGGARPLLGMTERSERSVLLFELGENGIRELDAFGGPRFDRRIDRASLPEKLGLPGMIIHRDDRQELLHLE